MEPQKKTLILEHLSRHPGARRIKVVDGQVVTSEPVPEPGEPLRTRPTPVGAVRHDERGFVAFAMYDIVSDVTTYLVERD